jgi:alpha-tubulin suppressor-like RCC1 family protein
VSNVVNTVGTTLAEYVVDTTIYGTVQSGQTHGINQGGFGNNTILNADGTRLLVTDPLNYPSGLGRAYIYHLESGSWVLKQTWDNPTGSGQRFADGVCMNEDGTRVFLMHSASEQVYTYEYASGAWPTANTGTHTISPGTIGGEYEGMACNKAGDVLLIGQGNVNTAKIYRRASATSWTQDSGGSFSKGRGVAMNGAGTRAFIGNSADATVHMTEWNGSTWSSLTQIIDESYSTWPCTMMSDSAGETLVIVSGGGDSNSGNSGIYERDSGTGSWSRAQGVNGDTEIYGMRLPSISYDGTMVLVGSYRHDSGKGRAQLWQKSGGSWSLTKEYLNPDASPASTDNFGSGCGIARTTKDKFVIGMEGDDTAGTDYGSVRVYTNAIPKYLDFDTYNKLSIQNITPTATTLKYGSNTYDIGTISNVYIENPGTYEAAIKASDKFVLASNTATYQVHPNTAYSNYRSIGGISAASTSLHNENITTTYSVTMWAKSASGSYILRTANSDSSTNPTNTHGIFGTDSTGKVSVPSWTSNNSISAEFNGTSVRDEWHFFGFEFEGSSIKLHLDGAVPISSTTAYTGQTHNRMRFDSPSVFTDGTRLAEFAVYNRALTDAEFVSIYNNGKPNGPDNVSSGRVSWFKCLSGAMATNSGSGGDFDATITEDVDVPSTWLDPTPYLTHDTYNKLSIQNITPTATTLKYDSNTYDIGTATDIYIANSGTYEIETKDANTFAFASNVVSGSITYPPSSTVNAGNFTLAFRHGTGTTDTSSNNCTLYSGMTTGDYDWGTVNSVTSSSTETTYNVTFSQMNNVNYLVLAGGGGGGNDYPEGGGGGGGMLDGTETSIPGNTYDIVVGNGGGRRVNGTNSSFYTLDSVGGGCGRSGVGADGGSGGGGRDNSAGGSGVAGPPRQGYNGGTGYIIDYGSGGGGGGAGGNGGNAGNHVGGTGGTGRVWSFNNTRYGGGGGGGTRNSAGGSGGAGGGGNGGQRLADGSNGTNYLGGGGGCKASGGSGTVILNFDATQSSTSPRYFSFDTYNKLVISNVTPTSSTLRLGSNTYDIGTATNIYVEDTGTYEIEAKTSNAFIFASNVVSGTIKTIEPALVGGNAHLHALAYDGKLYAWGINDDGELGLGDNTNKTTPTLYSGPLVSKILNKGWSGGNTRNETSWIKTVGNEVYATGKGDTYMIPGTSSDLLSFTNVTSYFGDQSLTSNNVVFVGGGERSCVALTESGNVWTWGTHDSAFWNLGQGTSASSSNTPKQITFGGVTDNISRVAFGHDHGVALDTDGDVWFWGQIWAGGASVDYPQTTLSDAQKSPHEIMTSNNIIGVSSTFFTIYAWQSDGTYYALGQDSHGQIGDGATSGGYTSWQKIEYFSANNITINEIYTGQYNVFADTSDGYYCWGYGASGAFGNGGTGNLASPTKWTNVSNIKLFSAGGSYMGAAITEDGKYYAWGSGSQTQRGDNDTGNITYPKYIDALPNILAPSFDFDGYDKVLAHMKPTSYVYEFFIAVVVGAVSENNELWLQEISSTGYSLKASMMVMNTQYRVNGIDYSAGTSVVSGLFDGSTGSTNRVGVYPGYHDLNQKIFTLTTSQELTNIVLSSQRPKYMPGWKIVLNGTTILEDSANNGTDGLPDPFTITKTLPPMSSSLTKYTKGTTTYDAGKASIVTVSDPGTYDAQIKSDTDFTLTSETVPATKASGLYTWAFHHGNFDNAYGDGDILTARDNGRFYADTPSYTGDIGTITPTSVSSFVYKFYCTVLPQLDTQSVGASFMSTTEISSTTTTLTSAMFVMADPNYVDPANGIQSVLFNGNINASAGYFVIKSYNDGGLAVDRHMFTITSPVELLQLSITTHRPGYMPGFKIILNDTHTLINETSNGGGSGTPSPYTKSHTFSSNYLASTHGTTYTFEPPSGGLTANVLMVAGGGGGGGRAEGGGGGAGGLVYTAGTSLAQGATKTIVVGNGDSGGIGSGSGSIQVGFNGKNTTFTGLDNAIGGGGGGSQNYSPKSGGSGGGGNGGNGSNYNFNTGASGTSSQGTAGGDGANTLEGGGGGGAGGVGATASSGNAGDGGIGKFFGTGSSFTDFGDEYGEGGYFAGGGGGGNRNEIENIPGGRGGGGYGGTSNGYMARGGSLHGMVHTGGGGGGAGTYARDQHPGYNTEGDGGVKGHGGRGGSGIVLIQTNVALPNGANTAVVQVGNPRRRSLPPAVEDMGSEVNRFYIIDSASMPTYKLPTHWYTDPVGRASNSVWTTQGSHSLQKRADGGTSNVFYVTSTEGIFEYGSYMAQTADAIFMPVEAQRYNGLLAIGSNSTNDIHFEMAADGTAALYYDNGATLLSAGTITCFTVGKWHHIALTVDSGGNAVGYVNGYPVVSGTHTSVAAVGSRSGNMHMRVGDHSITFRKFLTYEVSTYNFHMSPKQVLQRAAEVGLGPKLEYDGLNSINVVNIEKDSEITIYESNVNDTSNLYVVSCNESSYLLSNAGTYYAQIKGTDTFTIMRPLTVTEDHFPLYAYPPRDGTTTGLTTSTVADTWNTWTISGAANGNGIYQARSNRTATGTRNVYKAFSNNIGTGGIGEFQTVHSSGQHETGTLDLHLPSAKTIRKYVIWTTDSAFYTYNSTTYTDYDPTLPYNANERNYRRVKSWTIQGSNNDSVWTTIHTVTDKPPSIYGDVHTISSPGSYVYYRLNWSENNGSTETTTVAELIYWGDA